jgi:hypothetical protein
MMKNKTLDATCEELDKAGIVYTVETGKHHKVRSSLGLIICSVSCSDHRAELKARSLVRRLIKQNQSGDTKCGSL